MIEQVGNALTFYAQFLVSGAAGTGLTITCTVYKGSDGSTIVSAQAATEIGGGIYKYTLDSGSVAAEDDYLAVFNEVAATADQVDVPALWVVGRAGVEHLDENVSVGQNLTQRSEPPTADAIADQVWDETLGDHVGAGSTGKKLTDLTASLVQRSEPPTVSAIADQVWDEALSGHVAAGSAGKKLGDLDTDVLDNTVPGSYAAGTAGYALGRIGEGEFTVQAPVSADGETLTLVRGDDYLIADSREITISSDDWPDLSTVGVAPDEEDPVVIMTIRRRREAFGSGSDGILMARQDDLASRVTGAGTQSVTFELTSELSATPATGEEGDTNDLLPGTSTGKFDIQATLTTGAIITLATGLVTVTEDQTRA